MRPKSEELTYNNPARESTSSHHEYAPGRWLPHARVISDDEIEYVWKERWDKDVNPYAIPGWALRKRRRKLGITQARLSEMVGVSQATISHLERHDLGSRVLRERVLAMLESFGPPVQIPEVRRVRTAATGVKFTYVRAKRLGT